MALRNPCFKDQFGLIWGRETKREGEGEEKRKKKKKREEEEKKKKKEIKPSNPKVWKLNSSMDLWNSKAWFS